MSSRRLLTMLLSVGLLGLPMMLLGAGPASADGTWTTVLYSQMKPKVQLYKHTIGLAGHLVATPAAGGDPVPVSGQTVELQRKPAGSTAFVPVTSSVTDSDGYVTFYTPATSNAQFQLVFAGSTTGTDTYGASTSQAWQSNVMRDLHATSTQKGNRVYLKGNVDPGWGNKAIVLQRKTCKTCGWKAYDKQKTTRTGGWKFRTPGPSSRKGSWWYRAKVAGTSTYVTSYSATLRVYWL